MTETTAQEQALLESAITKAANWRDRDPFPRISPALLNSADIEDYATQCGMIHPFDAARLKPASYPVRVGAKIIYWDTAAEGAEPVRIPVKELSPGEEFSVPKNSLVFVQTEEVFLLPKYLAARFNLQISLVHKGLLLGTGPLVDPGFRGELLVPLHNLTENNYALCRGDEFIWVEFTKVSPNVAWDKAALADADCEGRRGTYRPYQAKDHDPKKPWPRAEEYIRRALRSENAELSPSCSIRNSWPKEVLDFRKQIKETNKTAESALARVNLLGAAAIVLPVVVAIGGYTTLVAPLGQTRADTATSSEQIKQLRKELDGVEKALAVDPARSNEIASIHQRLDTLESRLRTPTRSQPTQGNP